MTAIALMTTIQAWFANDEKSSCRIFADGIFYCGHEQPPPLAHANEEYHDCDYEAGKISSDCLAWYANSFGAGIGALWDSDL